MAAATSKINSSQLVRKLETLGVPVPIATLRLWASEHIIPNYEQHQPSNKPRLKKFVGARPKKGSDAAKKRQEKRQKLEENGEKVRPGRPCSLWLSETVEQAAAVWAVRYSGLTKPRALTTEMIEAIKRAAASLDERPFAVYTLPSIIGPLSTQRIASEDIKMKFVREDYDRLDLFPGADNTEKADFLNKLVVIWVAAIEKVRAWESDGIKAQAAESEWGRLLPSQIDFSQIDPWRVAVPCPWRIDKPALVKLYWLSRQPKNKNKSREFLRPPFPWQRTLSESYRDDLILFENFLDTRAFFRIDVTDSDEWAKTELEETERKLRSSTSPMEKLPLEIHQAWLRSWFGV
jgi:hypothetical protein